jgi:quinol-cytochrome oxidoreductase complex cytochrome b subunit
MEQIKQALKSRTVQFSIALAILSVVQGYVGILPVSPAGQAIVGCVIASCIAVLRFVTVMPIASK